MFIILIIFSISPLYNTKLVTWISVTSVTTLNKIFKVFLHKITFIYLLLFNKWIKWYIYQYKE